MSSSPTLLVLAAGMGSRYGGLKQIDPVGPDGEFIIDYSVHDAMRAGFRKIVFVIRKDIEEAFTKTIVSRLPKDCEVKYAFQELDMLPEGFSVPDGRKKPWGTGHALWVARDLVKEPALVINADDFYGAAAYQTAAEHFGSLAAPQKNDYFMVGYSLRKTVSLHGPVSRGVCRTDDRGFLADVTEIKEITIDPAGEIHSGAAAGCRRFSGDEIVSMNVWGFTPSIFDHLDRQFREFLRNEGSLPTAEFYIPSAVASLIHENAVRVKVLLTGAAEWVGATYAQDKPLVVEKIQGLIDAGVYPSPLWQ